MDCNSVLQGHLLEWHTTSGRFSSHHVGCGVCVEMVDAFCEHGIHKKRVHLRGMKIDPAACGVGMAWLVRAIEEAARFVLRARARKPAPENRARNRTVRCMRVWPWPKTRGRPGHGHGGGMWFGVLNKVASRPCCTPDGCLWPLASVMLRAYIYSACI